MTPRTAKHGILPDVLARGLEVLFVGINPGLRSAATGHHFAGFSNRFWKLLVEARLVPEPITYEDDHRLLEWGLGITNLVARPSRGVSDLRRAELAGGWRQLEATVQRAGPRVVALVGVTVYRAIRPMLTAPGAFTRGPRVPGEHESVIGVRPETIHGARVFVLPNPSGRNAHVSYADMLRAFEGLRRVVARATGSVQGRLTTPPASPCSARRAMPSAARSSQPWRTRRARARR